LSDQNPAMQTVKMLAETIRTNRKPVSSDNPLLAMERMASDWIIGSLDAVAAARDTMEEQVFLTTYGSPWLQALMGFGPDAAGTLKRADHDVLREATEARLRADLETRFEAGGLAEAVIRALVYIRLPEQSIDERGFTVAKAVREARPAGLRLSQPQLKALFRDQFLLLTMDPERAVRALPGLLPPDVSLREAALADIRRVLNASGRMSPEAGRRLAAIEAVFGIGAQAVPIQAAPIQAAPIQAAPIQAAPIQAASVPPASVPLTPIPPTAIPPTAIPPTAVPPTAVPPTAVPPTAVPPTAVPPTAVPATAVLPAAVSPPQPVAPEAKGKAATMPAAKPAPATPVEAKAGPAKPAAPAKAAEPKPPSSRKAVSNA
jgi:hypothetical protein